LYYGADCRESLRRLPDQSVHTVCTSPPYWGLRNYENELSVWGGDKDCDHEWGDTIPGSNKGGSGTPTDKNNRGENYGRGEPRGQYCTKCQAWIGQLGLEPTPYEFVEHLVEIFREVKRVLRDDGTLWLNLGDSYANPGIQSSALSSTGGFTGERLRAGKKGTMNSVLRAIPEGIKYKDLVGIPWMVAFALRANGWYLRADIIWAKKNPMPESVTDRPTKAHEYVFLLTKNEKYFYDAVAIKEPLSSAPHSPGNKGGDSHSAPNHKFEDGRTGHLLQPDRVWSADGMRNRRSVWDCNTKPYRGAHFATWPEDLVEPMILAGSGEKGCCPTCGAAYVRVVANQKPQEDTGAAIGGYPERHDGGTRVKDTTGAGGNTLAVKRAATVGMEPGCDCPVDAPVRCVVLDPFSGSATTGKVAMDHGRDYIGLDANTEYLDMAVARLQGRAAPQEAVAEESSILDIFG
jgi:DNA modification methylase